MIRGIAGMATLFIRKTPTIVGLILLSVCVCLAASGEKEVELNRVLEDITATAHWVDERTAVTAAVLAQLHTQSEALRTEIQEERRRVGAVTMRQALQARRIDCNLRLLRQAVGYSTQLEDRLAYFRTAANHLSVYRQQVRDDLLILRTLVTVDHSAFLRQVRKALSEFQQQCGAPLLSAKTDSGYRELETLWNDIVKAP